MDIDNCPFCGDWGCELAESAVPKVGGGQKVAVYCNNCFCEGPPAADPNVAIAKWNMREPKERKVDE